MSATSDPTGENSPSFSVSVPNLPSETLHRAVLPAERSLSTESAPAEEPQMGQAAVRIIRSVGKPLQRR